MKDESVWWSIEPVSCCLYVDIVLLRISAMSGRVGAAFLNMSMTPISCSSSGVGPSFGSNGSWSAYLSSFANLATGESDGVAFLTTLWSLTEKSVADRD